MNYDVSNHYLVKAIEELENVKEDKDNTRIVTNFVFELKVSSLIIPGVDNGEELVFETLISEEDGKVFLPLFTSEDEFIKHYGDDSEYEPIENEFEIYAGIADGEGIDAILIDAESLCFEVPKPVLEMAKDDFSISFDDIDTRSLEEIREVYENVSNESLVDFIRDEANADDFEGIMVELSNADIINLVASQDPLDDFAQDGAIKASDVGGFSLCTIEDGESRYAIMFADKQSALNAVQDDGLHYYGQLTKVSELFEFVLRNDMDGVIINPFDEEYTIPRSEIISQASGIELIVEDASFRNCVEYAFLL